MKKGWEVKRLGDVCEVIAGQSPEGKYYNEKGNGMPFYQGKKEFTEKYIGNPKVWTTKVTKEAIKDDILMSVRAPVGPINFSTQNICIGRGLAAIRAGSKINKEFLYNFLLKHEKEIIGNIGAVFDSINKKQIEDITILIPSLEEQQRIVSILDKAFDEIEEVKKLTEQNLKNAKELFESYLQEVFENKGEDWEEKNLEDLGIITSSKRIYKEEYVEDGIPFYRTKEIKELAHNKEISLELFIAKNRYDEIKSKYGVPKEGDILLSAVGTIGEIYVVKKEDIFYFKDGNIIWLKDFDSIDTYLLKYALTAYVEEIKKMSTGSAYNALTIEKLNKHIVHVPKSLEKQKEIVQKLDKLSAETKRLEAIYQQKLDSLEELKKSILQKAFQGEL